MENVGSDLWCSRSSEGHERNGRELGPQFAQSLIVWPEIMAPLADAVSFINDKASKHLTRIQALQSTLQLGASTQLEKGECGCV